MLATQIGGTRVLLLRISDSILQCFDDRMACSENSISQQESAEEIVAYEPRICQMVEKALNRRMSNLNKNTIETIQSINNQSINARCSWEHGKNK